MMKRICRFCSLLLTFAMLINLLPMSVLGAELQEMTAADMEPEDTESVQIIGEVTERRGEFSKEYVLSNGLHMAAVYDNPVHY